MEIDVQKLFVEQLTGLMQEKGLSITNLANLTKIPRSTINNWLLCNRNPQIDALWKLSNYFGCTIDYLLGKEN